MGRSLDEVGYTLSWADLEGFLDNCTALSAFHRKINPLGVFTDPVIKRLASIEDWLETLYREVRGAEDKSPVGAIGYEVRRLEAVEAAKKAATQPKAKVFDARAEIARRQAAAASGEYSEPSEDVSSTRPRSAAAQAMRDEVDRRIAAAN